MVIAVSGRYCSGKDTVSAILEKAGYRPVHLDQIAHRVLEEKRDEVLRVFGSGILEKIPGGRISRKKLGALVFRDEKKRLLLESILHPSVIAQAEALLKDSSEKNRVLNVPLLKKSGLLSFCDALFWVRASYGRRFFRALKRDHLSPREIYRRFSSQKDLNAHIFSDSVDTYTVTNRGSFPRLEKKVYQILEEAEKNNGQKNGRAP